MSVAKLAEGEHGTVTTSRVVAFTIDTHDRTTTHRTVIVLATILTIWAVLLVLVIGVCRAARFGDRAQEELYLPAASQRAPCVVVRRHNVGLHGALR